MAGAGVNIFVWDLQFKRDAVASIEGKKQHLKNANINRSSYKAIVNRRRRALYGLQLAFAVDMILHII